MQRFGEKLRGLRAHHGMTLTMLATSLGYKTHGYISEIESGKKYPTTGFVLSVAERFNVSLDSLLKDELEVKLPMNLPVQWEQPPTIAFGHRDPSEKRTRTV